MSGKIQADQYPWDELDTPLLSSARIWDHREV